MMSTQTCRIATHQERALPVLDAAHIYPYSQGGVHSPANGLMKLEHEKLVWEESLERRFRRKAPEVDLLDVLSGGCGTGTSRSP